MADEPLSTEGEELRGRRAPRKYRRMDEPLHLDGEEWRDIPGLGGTYQASSLGRIRSVRIMRQFEGVGDYNRINTTNPDGSQQSRYVHRLICAAFHEKAGGKDQVAHWDGDRHNNRADNLRWATALENQQDKVRHGTQARGANHPKAKFTAEQVHEIRAKAVTTPLRRLAREYDVNDKSIRDIVNGKHWKHV